MPAFDRHTLNFVGGVVAIGLVLNLLFLTVALLFLRVPVDNKDPLMLLLGGLMSQVTTVVAFFFGATVGSRRQEETIGKLVDNPPPPPPAPVTLQPGDRATVAATVEVTPGGAP